MNHRSRYTITAAAATLLSALPLYPVFVGASWIVASGLTIAIICGALLGARALRTPLWSQPLIGLAALLLAVTWERAGSHAFGGIIPTLGTLRFFKTLVVGAGSEMNQYSIPVNADGPLLFLTTVGIGIAYVLIDTFAVALRRPALAGLPMLAIYATSVEIDQKSTSLFTFAIAAAAFLWLLVSDSLDRVRLFGRRFTGEGRGLDMWETSPLASVGRRITVVGVVLAIAIPGILPGIGSGFLHTFGGNGNGSGTCTNGKCQSQGTKLDLIANLAGKLDVGATQNLFTVQTDSVTGQYLQVGTEELLTKTGFGDFEPDGRPLNAEIPNPANAPAVNGLTYNPDTARVTIQGLGGNLLPVFREPLPLTLNGVGTNWYYDPSTTSVYGSSPDAVKRGMTYTFQYEQPSWDAGDLQQAGIVPSDNLALRNDEAVPQPVPAVTAIVQKYATNQPNEYLKVLALYDYFSGKNGFTYKLLTKDGTTGTDIGDFLQQKQGYCVQYAAALAWLVRAAGYPSRVAFGFTMGAAINGSNGARQITNRDYHAWTEVYFSGFGWVPFDATPAASGGAAGRRLAGVAVNEGEPWIVIDDDDAQASATRHRVHAAWAEFIDTLVDFGLLVDPSETPRATTERIVRTVHLSEEAIAGTRIIGSAEQHTRYARRPAATPSLEPELRRLRRELTFGQPFPARLRAVLVPPSVVARWNGRITDAAATTSARLQAIRDSISRALQIRRWTSAPRRLLGSRSSR
jgi:TgpA N-terminal domain/Transglutaminase-like superfamily